MDDLNRTMIASGFMLSLWAWASRRRETPKMAVVESSVAEQPVHLVLVWGGLAEVEGYEECWAEAA